jgi:hypothetical protein
MVGCRVLVVNLGGGKREAAGAAGWAVWWDSSLFVSRLRSTYVCTISAADSIPSSIVLSDR